MSQLNRIATLIVIIVVVDYAHCMSQKDWWKKLNIVDKKSIGKPTKFEPKTKILNEKTEEKSKHAVYTYFDQSFNVDYSILRPQTVYQHPQPLVVEEPVYSAQPIYHHPQPLIVEEPVYPANPILVNEPVYPAKPILINEPAYPAKPILVNEPVYPAKPILVSEPAYPAKPILVSEPAYPAKPILVSEPAYPAKPILVSEPIYPAKPILIEEPVHHNPQPIIVNEPVYPAKPILVSEPVIDAAMPFQIQQPVLSHTGQIIVENTLGGINFDCSFLPSGHFRDNEFCDVYHACVHGYHRKTYTCPIVGSRTYFDEVTQRCEFVKHNPLACSINRFVR